MRVTFDAALLKDNSSLEMVIKERFAPDDFPSTTHRVMQQLGFVVYLGPSGSAIVPAQLSNLSAYCPTLPIDKVDPSPATPSPTQNLSAVLRPCSANESIGTATCSQFALQLNVSIYNGNSFSTRISSVMYNGTEYDISPTHVRLDLLSVNATVRTTTKKIVLPLFEETTSISAPWVSSGSLFESPRFVRPETRGSVSK